MDKSKLGIYVFKKGTSYKFWSCMPNWDENETYLTCWGKYGTRGTSLNVPRLTAMERIREKIKKGYVLEKSYEYIAGGGLAVEEKEKLRAMFIDKTGLLDNEENRKKIEEEKNATEIEKTEENILAVAPRIVTRKRL